MRRKIFLRRLELPRLDDSGAVLKGNRPVRMIAAASQGIELAAPHSGSGREGQPTGFV
jgi:hypothetical protein